MLTTTILSMSLAPATGFAAANPESVTSVPEGMTFSDFSAISQDKVQAVQKAVEQGLLNGFPDGRFDPKKTLSRQELAVILSKALHLLPESSAASSFSDTTQSWATPYIEAVRKAGLMGGDAGNAFRPNDPVTNEELAAVFVRAVRGVGAKGEDESSGTPADGKVSEWAKDAFNVSQRMGLMVSDEEALDPRGNVEREDIAAFLIEIFKNEERTAVINKIDGDFVTIDGQPMLIDGQLKALFAGKNKEALEGAILKYTLLNRNVDGLAELEIVKGGSEEAPVSLDMTGSTFNGVLRIAGDNLAVKGEELSQIEIKQGVKQVELHVNASRVSVLTDEPVKLKGAIEIQSLVIANEKARITLDKGVMIDKVELPSSVKASQVISNYEQSKQQIKNREQEPVSTPTQTPTTPPAVVNQPPADSGTAITPAAGTAGGTAVTVDLSGTFTDEDASSLVYTAASSNAGIATASVTGTTLSLTPVAEGSATITVTATDNGALTATRTFTFTVNAAPVVNQPPAAASGVITPAAGTAGGTAVTVDLNGTFTDEEPATLTYTATSSATGVATVSVTGTTLSLTPVTEGSATITVTATDIGGLTATRTFAFTVNAAPVVNQPPAAASGAITPAAGTAGGTAVTVELNGTFTDEEPATLTYSATSSATGVATVSVTGTTLTLTPLSAGNATIEVTATDIGGLTATRTFAFTVNAAQVQADLKSGAYLYVKPDGDVSIDTSTSTYYYSKRNIHELLTMSFKGASLTNVQYNASDQDFDVYDSSNTQVADITLESSDPSKLAVVDGKDLQPASSITESDSITLTMHVKTVDGGTDDVVLPITVDATAPTVTNVTLDSNHSKFTITMSERVIIDNVGTLGTDEIAYSLDGVFVRNLSEYTDYTKAVTGTNQVTVTLLNPNIIGVNGSSFTFKLSSLTDYADNTSTEASAPYTVVIDNSGIPGG